MSVDQSTLLGRTLYFNKVGMRDVRHQLGVSVMDAQGHRELVLSRIEMPQLQAHPIGSLDLGQLRDTIHTLLSAYFAMSGALHPLDLREQVTQLKGLHADTP